MSLPSEPVTDPILTAEEFDRECRRREARRVHQLAGASQRLDADIRSQRVWATVVALVFLGVLALIGFIVHAVTAEHDSEHRHQISVYCYADPNSNRSTSEATGSPVDLATFCPDHR